MCLSHTLLILLYTCIIVDDCDVIVLTIDIVSRNEILLNKRKQNCIFIDNL